MIRERPYRVGRSTLTVRFGDLTTSDAEVLVSSDDHFITMGSGVSRALRRAGGESIALDAAMKVPAELGDVIVTTAGALPARYIFHGITIGRGRLPSEVVIDRITRRCLRLVADLHVRSIAFPAIGAGTARFRLEAVAAVMGRAITAEVLDRDLSIDVSLYLLDSASRYADDAYAAFFAAFEAAVPDAGASPFPAASREPEGDPEPGADGRTRGPARPEENGRGRLHQVRRHLVELEQQRARIEETLIDALPHAPIDVIRELRERLAQNQELRLQYLGELQELIGATGAARPAGPAPGERAPLRVFVSSTSLDLQEHRAAARNAIQRTDCLFRGMEHFGAEAARPAGFIQRAVEEADVYLGIFGVRYGSIDPVSGRSMTELEFRAARRSGRQMCLYWIHDDADVKAAHVERTPDGVRLLAALDDEVMRDFVVLPLPQPAGPGAPARRRPAEAPRHRLTRDAPPGSVPGGASVPRFRRVQQSLTPGQVLSTIVARHSIHGSQL